MSSVLSNLDPGELRGIAGLQVCCARYYHAQLLEPCLKRLFWFKTVVPTSTKKYCVAVLICLVWRMGTICPDAFCVHLKPYGTFCLYACQICITGENLHIVQVIEVSM